jgi:hypothetical protein
MVPILFGLRMCKEYSLFDNEPLIQSMHHSLTIFEIFQTSKNHSKSNYFGMKKLLKSMLTLKSNFMVQKNSRSIMTENSGWRTLNKRTTETEISLVLILVE